MRLVLDTNVLVAAQRSPKGASARLMRAIEERRIVPLVSVALFLEYEAVLTRAEHMRVAGIDEQVVHAALAALLSASEPVDIWFALRPSARDPDDDMVVEAAVNGRADGVATFETAGFAVALRRFGIQVMTPVEVWRRINP